MTPQENPSPQPMPAVWLAVAAIVGLLAFAALSMIVSPPGIKGEQLKLHRYLIQAEGDHLFDSAESNKEAYADTILDLKAIPLQDPAAVGTRERALIVLRHIIDSSLPKNFSALTNRLDDDGDALTPQAESNDDIAKVNAALREIYSGKKITEERVGEIAKTLGKLGARWPLDKAIRHATDKTDEQMSADAMLTFGAITLGLIAFSGTFIIFLGISKGERRIPLVGSPGLGDNLGIRFLLFIAVFSFGGAAVSSVFPDRAIGSAVAIAVIIVFIVLFLSMPIKNVVFSLRDLGIRFDQIRGDILYGLGAFLANFFPVMLLIIFGQHFLRWIPSGGHPMQTEILAGPNLPLMILTAGPLTAIMEELAFRGALFQGMALRFRPWPAIILSSLAFAMIHPQGGALWPVLAWIGGMAAYLTYRRQSLIPAIVMHACHNTAIILISVYLPTIIQ